MGRRMRARRFEHVEGADDVAVEIGARVLDRVAHPGLRREMDDDLRMLLGKKLQQEIWRLDRRIYASVVSVLHQHRFAPALEGDIVIVGQRIDPDDAKPVFQKPSAGVEADEACRAGHQYRTFVHCRVPFFSSDRPARRGALCGAFRSRPGYWRSAVAPASGRVGDGQRAGRDFPFRNAPVSAPIRHLLYLFGLRKNPVVRPPGSITIQTKYGPTRSLVSYRLG